VKLTAVFTVPVVGPLTLAVNRVADIVIRRNAEPVLALLSVTVNVTLYVPFTAKVEENVDEVPEAGLPPVTAHA
jgi:hypothetical protein